jgi:excisionase family DNA binding protein
MQATSDSDGLFLRPSEAAALAGLSTRAIYRAIQRGELQAVRLCSRLRISRVAFGEWIRRSTVQPPEREPEPLPITPPPAGSFRPLLDRSLESRS